MLSIALTGALIVANKYYEKKVQTKLQLIQSQHQQELKQQLDSQQNQIKDLEVKVQSKAIEKARIAAQTPVEAPKALEIPLTPKAEAAPVKLDTSDAKMFIYMHESGNRPDARNAGGCLGIGQACPGSKLLAVCPTLEYNCEDQFFTSYMVNRYGSWANAQAFWLAHNYW